MRFEKKTRPTHPSKEREPIQHVQHAVSAVIHMAREPNSNPAGRSRITASRMGSRHERFPYQDGILAPMLCQIKGLICEADEFLRVVGMLRKAGHPNGHR